MASRGGGGCGAGRLVEPGDPAWEDALARVPHDVYHLPGYSRVEAEVLAATPVAFVYRGERHTFLLPLLLRPVPGSAGMDAVSPYGYPGPVSDHRWTTTRPGGRRWRPCTTACGRGGSWRASSGSTRCSRVGSTPWRGSATVVQHGRTVSID